MKVIRFVLVSFILTLFIHSSYSQVTSIPSEAKSNFAKQYPDAQNVRWDNDVVNVNVRFELNGEKMNAEYNNKGIWKSTIKESTYESLPETVKDGFKKSKYADRTVGDTKVIYYPGEVVRYRLKVEKNGLPKKYLFFNSEGKLVRDVITL